ncbi:heterodisulfide reductase-related iron-sulfur binding cluster [Geobacter argillaceus]|uniref:Fe-S oxidoreductase n=1 Tax=Geobacter argillaceus TaxID=345631 RepID=A0A562VKG3_9BACT|nr:heterodisulfide reductase-related iron-sulfur binding cluster [Geobacter argillaceus]TWJ18345.1 Fe-S oxidoreductase [Geobacter argillaceus]
METTRELYWNIGHGATVLLPMYLFTFAALGFLVKSGLQRLNIYRQGKPLNRTDQRAVRIGALVKNVLLQSRVLLVKGPGYAHGLFFWGFGLLFIGTCFVAAQADFTDLLFHYRFLNGDFYKYFSLVLDLAGLAAFAMLLGLLVRRYLVRPAGLESTLDDTIMHGLLFAILITGFVIEGARMAVTELPSRPDLVVWSPVGLLFAKALAGAGEGTLRTLHQTLWWIHFFLVIGFICAIPYTKFRHIFTTAANYFFVDLGPKGALVTVDMEGDAESFGTAQLKDLTWKDIFDTDACTKCKRCQDRCPAHNTDKPLSPMKVINQLGEVACSNPEANLIETVSKDALWSCTTCRACQEICPASIEHVNKIVDMRRNLVLMEGEFPGEEVMVAMDNTEVNGNPLGMAYASRGDWAKELPVSVMADNADVDILYFVGCYASFDKRNIKVATSFVQLCAAAGVKVGILGKEEKCCGEPMRKLGNEYLYQSMASENIETIKGYGVKKVVTACPHCFNTLAKDYRDLGFDIDVEHYTVYLNRLQQEGKLKLKADGFDCTYHDSCYIGRYNDLYDEPRALLAAAGGSIREMDRNQAQSFCCGAGGGRIMAEEKLGSRISESRAKMAAATGSGTLVSNCPFCLTMFEDGIKGAELEGQLVPRDIAEILVERLSI